MDTSPIIKGIIKSAKKLPSGRALLVGISGIDASGKGFITEQLEHDLKIRGINTAAINADGWLNLPHIRFGYDDPGRHFYNNAMRLDELFEQLITPLKWNRCIRLDAELVRETSNWSYHYVFDYSDIDVILLEGIFLFKRRYVSIFDLRIWVDCSFETALKRAIERGQEGHPENETIRAYEEIYFPAQKVHFQTDDPKSEAHILFANF